MADLKGEKDFNTLVAEEDLMLSAIEAVAGALEHRGVTRKEFAERLGVSAGEITQRMSGSRNLTLRTLADMLHALDAEVDLHVRFREVPAALPLPAVGAVAAVDAVGDAGWIRLPERWKEAADHSRADLSLAA